jgi:hypothetical protein
MRFDCLDEVNLWQNPVFHYAIHVSAEKKAHSTCVPRRGFPVEATSPVLPHRPPLSSEALNTYVITLPVLNSSSETIPPPTINTKIDLDRDHGSTSESPPISIPSLFPHPHHDASRDTTTQETTLKLRHLFHLTRRRPAPQPLEPKKLQFR